MANQSSSEPIARSIEAGQKQTYQAPKIVALGDGRQLIQSDSFGPQLDGDSDPKYRNKNS